ncbi:54S ribosomal protein L2 mitochondrial [Arachnomyces sp. PD_36]|nr:54S ribosomal protein L2 mitochondrial [Arachnomyces sp. PD_36]
MVQPRLRTPMRALDRALSSLQIQQQPLQQQFLSSRISTSNSATLLRQQNSLPTFLLQLNQVRHASHNTQGRANSGARDSAGRRLGAKKSGDQYVIPGNIIFRQRGTKWFPGENCDMGKDHTIYATETGYVKYYIDPERHPDRKYIGVAFNREDRLPTPRNAVTRRRLGMVAIPRTTFNAVDRVALGQTASAGEGAGVGPAVKRIIPNKAVKGRRGVKRNLPLRPGYMYREANWEIGRAAEVAGIKTEEWNRKDRWGAWRKKLERIKRVAQMRELKNKRKGKKKPKKA